MKRPNRLSATASRESGSGVILAWQANHAYAAGEAMTQSSNTWTRNSAGTSRGTFDGTEQAAWTILPVDASVIESVNTVATAGASQTLPAPEVASQSWLTLTAASCAITLPAGGAGKSFLLALKQDGTGGRDVTWVGTVTWVGGDLDLVTDPNAVTLISFVSDPAGNWLGIVRGAAAAVSAYRAAVMADSPISYWRLGESSGTTAADETTANPGAYTGGVTLGTAGLIASDANTAATFDGTNGHVVVKAGHIVCGLVNWTIEGWANLSSLSGSPVLYSERGSAGADILASIRR